ncbi:hypothetical protein BS78_05G070900 [Paspalum vaginatum]|nr:hypothetical protein BS78_05G070900 [Paspalum vaginatum]
MDDLVWPAASSCSSPSPSSFFSTACHVPQLELVSWDDVPVPEQWMGADDWVDDRMDELLDVDGSSWGEGDESSRAAGNDDMSDEPPAPEPKMRGRKPGPRPQTNGPVLSHVEAERQRRDKLTRRFRELRAAVPTVSRMDKASLLAHAAAYIAGLRNRVEQLEAEAKRQAEALTSVAAGTGRYSVDLDLEEKLEVRMVGQEVAALRLTTAARHASARLMVALCSLDLPVQQACLWSVGGETVQDAVVGVPSGLQDELGLRLRAALLHRLQRSG